MGFIDELNERIIELLKQNRKDKAIQYYKKNVPNASDWEANQYVSQVSKEIKNPDKINKPLVIGFWSVVLVIIVIISVRNCSSNNNSTNYSNSSASDMFNLSISTNDDTISDAIDNNEKKDQSIDELESVKADLNTYTTNLQLLREEKNITVSDIPRLRTLLEDAQDFYRKYNLSSDTTFKSLKKNFDKFKSDLINTQKYIYPKLRKAFADNARNNLWEEDIKVQYSGTTITFIGYQYATNRNIKDSYNAISEALFKLRFKRVNFKWNTYGEYTYYDTKAPNDSEII